MQKQKYVYSFFSFFKKIVVNAHPTLFTRIGLNGQGEPVQSVDDSETFTLEVEHTADIERKQSQRLAYCLRRWESLWRRLTPTARSTAYSRAHSSPPYMPI